MNNTVVPQNTEMFSLITLYIYMYIVFRTYNLSFFIQGSIISMATKLVDRKEKNQDSIPGSD